MKHYFITLLDIILALILFYAVFGCMKLILNHIYVTYQHPFVQNIWIYWRMIKSSVFGTPLLLIIFGLGIMLCYILLTYRKNKAFFNIIDETGRMAKGELNKSIETRAKGNLRVLVDNINSISEQLKKLTVEERRAQYTKNDLITNVSHDLRTPLTSIIGYLDIIENDRYRDEVELRYYTSIAYAQAKNLNVLINDLFELTKMQNHTFALKKSKINLVELVGQVIVYMGYQITSAGMKIRPDFLDERLMVYADGEKLMRALNNLLSNAIKYGMEDVYIDLIVGKRGNAAMVQVINYGDPIPAIDLPYLFDRFYRVEKSRNREVGGSGLGLAITKNIIELHQGSITVRSDQSGTVFEICLPLVTAHDLED